MQKLVKSKSFNLDDMSNYELKKEYEETTDRMVAEMTNHLKIVDGSKRCENLRGVAGVLKPTIANLEAKKAMLEREIKRRATVREQRQVARASKPTRNIDKKGEVK